MTRASGRSASTPRSELTSRTTSRPGTSSALTWLSGCGAGRGRGRRPEALASEFSAGAEALIARLSRASPDEAERATARAESIRRLATLVEGGRRSRPDEGRRRRLRERAQWRPAIVSAAPHPDPYMA